MPGSRETARAARHRPATRSGRWAVWAVLVLLLPAVPWAGAQDAADPSDAPTGPPPLDDDDGSGHLMIGGLATLRVDADDQAELKFLADGAGMLTLAWSSDADSAVQVQVLNPAGQMMSMDTGQSRRSWAMPVQAAMVPLGEAGLYRVRLIAPTGSTSRLGGAWMPFSAMRGSASELVNPAPQPQQTLAITPGVRQQVQIPRDGGIDGEYFQWMSFTAEGDGQLALMFSAVAGDIRLMLYEEGDYNHALEYVDQDMRGDTASESILIDARAGRTYYLRVIDTARGNRIQLRSIWLATDQAAAEDAAEDAHDDAAGALDDATE